jgi:DNA-binding IclR family transcriptional regulator
MSSMAGFPDSIGGRGTSSLQKMLALLDVFSTEAPAWSTEDLIRFSGTSRSTCYRYVKALQQAGLLTPVSGGA